jgi:signal peptidase I
MLALAIALTISRKWRNGPSSHLAQVAAQPIVTPSGSFEPTS